MLVSIEDVNDNPPEFDQLSYAVTLVENSPLNTIVLRVAVTDRDQVKWTSFKFKPATHYKIVA